MQVGIASGFLHHGDGLVGANKLNNVVEFALLVGLGSRFLRTRRDNLDTFREGFSMTGGLKSSSGELALAEKWSQFDSLFHWLVIFLRIAVIE